MKPVPAQASRQKAASAMYKVKRLEAMTWVKQDFRGKKSRKKGIRSNRVGEG